MRSFKKKPAQPAPSGSWYGKRLLYWVGWLALAHLRLYSAGVALHADGASMAPDGVRVAYLQSDRPMVRIVVVNLDEPSRTMYFNLGEDFTDPVGIFWNSSRNVELRTGSKAFARFTVDPERTEEAHKTDSPLLPVPNDAMIAAELRHKLPHRSIEILNWDKGKRRVLILAATDSMRGRYFVYDRADDLLFEVSYRKPKSTDP